MRKPVFMVHYAFANTISKVEIVAVDKAEAESKFRKMKPFAIEYKVVRIG